MKTAVESVFLRLLEDAVSGEQSGPVIEFTDADWQQFCSLSMRQGVAPLVYNEVLCNKEYALPESIRMEMKQVCASQMLHYPRLQALLRTTFDHLTQAQLQPVLLKGFGLAELYPRPELRVWGDLDVYVGPVQYHKAASVLRSAFPNAKHHDEEWEELKHYNFVMPDGLIEMHRHSILPSHPRDKEIYFRLEKEAMLPDHTESLYLSDMDRTVILPELKFNMFFTFLHAWNHFVEEGLAWKQLCDVYLLARKAYYHYAASAEALQEYQTYLQTNVKAMCLQEAWQLVGYMLVDKLHLPAQMWFGYEGKQCDTFYHEVMDEGLLREQKREALHNRYIRREQSLQMPRLLRKWKTLRLRFADSRWLKTYAPRYARHQMAAAFYKGMSRLFKKEKTVLY